MNPTDNYPDHDTVDALFSAALRDACSHAEATDLELTVAAESGISAIPPRDRERVLNAIASNHSGALGAPVLHAVLQNEQAETQPPRRISGTTHQHRSVLYRVGQVGLAAAASLALLFTIQLATLSSSDYGIQNTPLEIGAEDASGQSSADAERERLLKALLAFSGAGGCVMLAIILIARRTKHNQS